MGMAAPVHIVAPVERVQCIKCEGGGSGSHSQEGACRHVVQESLSRRRVPGCVDEVIAAGAEQDAVVRLLIEPPDKVIMSTIRVSPWPEVATFTIRFVCPRLLNSRARYSGSEPWSWFQVLASIHQSPSARKSC